MLSVAIFLAVAGLGWVVYEQCRPRDEMRKPAPRRPAPVVSPFPPIPTGHAHAPPHYKTPAPRGHETVMPVLQPAVPEPPVIAPPPEPPAPHHPRKRAPRHH